MTEILRLGNNPDVHLILDQPLFNDEGWLESYRARLESRNLKAEVVVDNAPYGESVVEYFRTLNQHWKGWEGERSWYSLEGECSFSASMAKTGHVALTVRLNVYPNICEATAVLDIEAGQLEALTDEMRQFFKQ